MLRNSLLNGLLELPKLSASQLTSFRFLEFCLPLLAMVNKKLYSKLLYCCMATTKVTARCSDSASSAAAACRVAAAGPLTHWPVLPPIL